MDDRTVVRKCLTGNTESFSHIVNRYKNRIYRYITSFVYDREEARDLAQETFVKAFRYLKSYDREQSFSAWLFKIARNNAMDHINKTSRRLDRVARSEDAAVRAGGKDVISAVEEKIDRLEMGKTIWQAVNSLPEIYRACMVLRYYGSSKYDEIAETLGIPIGTVKFRLNKAKLLLKEKLSRHLDPASFDM